MKKLLLLPLVFAAVACTHGATQNASQVDFDDKNYTVYLGPNDRAPAQAPTLTWEKSVKGINVSQAGGSLAYDAVSKQVQRWVETETYQDTCYRTEDKWVPDICYDWQCTGDSGQSEAWNAFYSAPKAEKADRLADAIKGVGKGTADKLIAGGYFHKKPRSWDEFKNAIKRAEKNGDIQRDAAYDVIYTYRNENLVTLGYTPNSCTSYSYNCEVFKRGVLTPYSCLKEKQVEKSQVVDVVHRNVEVVIKNPQVQSFEQDRVTLTIGKDYNDIQWDSVLTRYALSIPPAPVNGVTRIQLDGQERYRIALPSEALVGNSGKLAKAASNVAQFSAQVQPQYIAKGNDANDQLVLRYTVHSCKTSVWALGSCTKWTYNSPVQEVKVTTTNPTVNITMQPSHNLLEVKYTIARRNSKWYNDNYLPEQKTKQFKLK